MSATSHKGELHPSPPQILSLSKVWGNLVEKSTFSKNHFWNFKKPPKAVEISATLKIFNIFFQMLKVLLTTKNVVWQHLLPIYETIFEIFLPHFWQKMQFFGFSRQKFLRVGTSEGPISKKSFQKNCFKHMPPISANYLGKHISSLGDRIGGGPELNLYTT